MVLSIRGMRGWVALALVILLATALGCRPKKKPAISFDQPLPEGQLALRKISPAEYPDFTVKTADLPALLTSIDHSISYLQKPSSQQFFPYLDISHARALATLQAFRSAVVAGSKHTELPTVSFNQLIRDRFEVYQSIGAPAPQGGYTNIVQFTGYFTPIYEGSLTRGGKFQYPLYKRPADLLSDPNTGEVLGRRTAEGAMVPYYTRGEIEQGDILAGQELCWVASRWDAYVITVQGSAKLRLPDGRMYEIGYAGNNGYDYTSPGKQMLSEGIIDRSQLTLRGLRAYFQQNPQQMDKYLPLNQRYVFFTERPGGPFGSLNVPVTAKATIATDKAVYPRALAAFLIVPIPTSETGAAAPYRGFMMDQDTGGAIRAAGRCDIYMGVGDQAEKIAGHQLHEGSLYYIALKPQFMSANK